MQRQFFLAIGAAIMLAIGLSSLAQAQQILVMNEQRILRESAVGQHVASEIERISGEIANELSPLGTQIQQENEALTAETAALSEEAIRARPDLISRLQTLQSDAQQFEVRRQVAAREIQATERAAMQPVLGALQNILQEIVDERGAALLIDRSTVVFAADSIDISDQAIARLNEVMPTTPVNRVRLPQQQAQGAAAGQE